MLRTAENTVEKHSLINQGDRIVAAVSGGPDSMALLFFLSRISLKYGITLFALHVNHMIRAEDAEKDARFVERFCAENSIELFVAMKNVPELSKRDKLSIEEAGRNARLEAYGEALVMFSADKIAVGHNRNDNAETLLFRLVRGSGAKGLEGISPKSAVGGSLIIRPLIDCPRKLIESCCAENQIPYITDATNNTDFYSRNRIRLSLIPWLEQNMNPKVVDSLVSSSEILKEQNDFIERHAEKAYNNCLLSHGDNRVELNVKTLGGCDIAIKKLIIRRAIERTSSGLRNISSAHINDIVKLLEKGTGKKTCLPGGLICETCYNSLVFRKDVSGSEFGYELIKGQPVYIRERGFYVAFSDKELKPDNFKNLCTKILKCDKILFKLYYRTRLPGDKIKLSFGTKKLSDLFIDKKIPLEQRDRAAVISDGENILSVLDVCDSEYVKRGENSYYIQIWEDTNG